MDQIRRKRTYRCTELLPVGQQLVERLGLDDGATEDVAADLGALLEDDDAPLLAARVGELELLESDGRAETSRTGADNADIDVVLGPVGRRRRELAFALVRRAQAGEGRGKEAPGNERPASDDRQA